MLYAAFYIQKVWPKACNEWIRFHLNDFGFLARLFKSDPFV